MSAAIIPPSDWILRHNSTHHLVAWAAAIAGIGYGLVFSVGYTLDVWEFFVKFDLISFVHLYKVDSLHITDDTVGLVHLLLIVNAILTCSHYNG